MKNYDEIISDSMISIFILKNLQDTIDEGYIMILEDVALVLFDYEKYLVKIFDITHEVSSRIITETLISAGIQVFILNYQTKEITSLVKNNTEQQIILLNKLRMEAHNSKMVAVSNINYEIASKYRDIEISILKVIDNISKKKRGYLKP